jgi:YD repeat-containing protein
MASSNNQPSWVGDGFELGSGFIERSYRGCGDDMSGPGHNNTVKTGDLCWETDNATLSLSGHSGELIKDNTDANRWHLREDDGSLITHKTGIGNGDNDGEWWIVTTTDGKQYWFGGLPGSNSTWTVPVYGNDPGEPCRQPTFAASACAQAWRWNLDFVVDTHANTMTYTYVNETNKYGRNMSTTDLVGYDRGGYLDTIDYGTHTGVTGPAPMRVSFATADRCLTGCGTHDPAHWPDTPWDQECTVAPCNDVSPTFWTTKRLASVTTRVWDALALPPGYRNVEVWTLTHSFLDPGDGTRAGLWLARISHTGLVGATTTVPDVVFSGVQLANRVDTRADQYFPMNWWRISRIDTESGGAIIVNYAPQECVPGATMPDTAHLESNTLRCYPVRWTPSGATAPIIDFFHKYVVAQVREGDLTGGAPDVIHDYDYVGGAAWHYTDDDGLITAANKTWSVWRGYATVRERTGDPAVTAQTRTDTQYFRGMHGDHLPTGTRTVTLPAVDMNGDGDTTDPGVDAPAAPDEDLFAGSPRAVLTYNGVAGAELSATVNELWQSAPTATRTINATTVSARVTATVASHTRMGHDTDGGTRPAGTRSTSTATTVDALGMAVEVEDRGDDAVAGDEQCTLTDYARNTNPATGVWLAAYPSRVRTFAVGCAAAKTGGLTDADIMGDTLTIYDAQATGAAPVKGDATEVRNLKTYNAGNPAYLTVTRKQYDSYGRVTDTWDVDNNHTATAYTPATGGPVTQTVSTNPLGWTTTTQYEPAWGQAKTTVDPNGKRTDATYDGLGRTTAVWKPGQDQAAGQGATTTYSYLMRTNGASTVTTNTLTATGGYLTSIVLYDGMLRQRQTQSPDKAIPGARLVQELAYDSAGRTWKATNPYPMTGNPSNDIYTPLPPVYSGPEALPGWTVKLFDGAGRTTDEVFYSHNVEQWRTSTTYTADRITTTPPAGGTPTATIADARGRSVALRQYHGATPVGGYDTTSYTYNRKDQLSRLTDAAGNHWDYTYDLAGRAIQTDDPDKGRTASTYDNAGRVTTTTDARNLTLAYTYDQLGRRTTLRDTSVTGPVRAEWTYDTVVKGYPGKSTRYDAGGNAYSTEIQSYSDRYAPGIVRYTLPPTETSFGPTTSFSFSNSFNPDGSPDTSRIPAAGGLARETLTYRYNAAGLPDSLLTDQGGTLVTATGYTNYGEPGVLTLQNNAGKVAQIGSYYEEGTRRLHELKTTSAAAPTTTYTDVFYSYDAAGNILKADDTISGDHQCYGYDYLRRLTEAWTPTTGDCSAARTVAGLGGPAPYWQSWTYDLVGNRRTQVDHAATNTTATYTYHDPATAQPHAVQQIAYSGATTRTDTYGYDSNGNTTTRPAGTAGQTLTWDPEGHVATATDSTGTTSFLYDADGNRLIRTDPTGKPSTCPGRKSGSPPPPSPSPAPATTCTQDDPSPPAPPPASAGWPPTTKAPPPSSSLPSTKPRRSNAPPRSAPNAARYPVSGRPVWTKASSAAPSTTPA